MMQPPPLEEASAPAPVRPYGTDSARMIADYPEFGIMSFLPGGTFGARAKTETGAFIGTLISAVDLDELADKLDRARRRLAGM